MFPLLFQYADNAMPVVMRTRAITRVVEPAGDMPIPVLMQIYKDMFG